MPTRTCAFCRDTSSDSETSSDSLSYRRLYYQRSICASCVEDSGPDFFPPRTCTHCGILVETHQAVLDCDRRILCPACYLNQHATYCLRCNGQMRSGADVRVLNRSTISRLSFIHAGCMGSDDQEEGCTFDTCLECGGFVDDGGCMLCSALTIHQYSFQPELVFNRPPNSCEELFLGLELEVTPETGTGTSHAAALRVLPDLVYAKCDSSIPSGFEIVSHPMSLMWMRDNFHQYLSMLPKLYELGYRSAQGAKCGTHIHMSAVAFTHTQLYRFMYAIYGNPTLSLILSQRTPEQFEEFSTTVDPNQSYKSRSRTKQQGGRNRHDAVNISPKHTIEVRTFNGTLNPLTMMKNIETVLCLYSYAQDTPTHAISANSILAYVKANRHLYRYLSLFLELNSKARDAVFEYDGGPLGTGDDAQDKNVQRLYERCLKTGGAVSVS